MKYKFEIDKRLMGLNEYTKINRENKYMGNQAKQFAKKFILDALVNAGVLEDDNRKIVTNFTDDFEYAKKSKVIVELEELEN